MEGHLDFAADPGALFAEAVAIMARLRAPGGCPWDREQTFTSIQPYTLEETYEVFDAIERGQWQDLCEELGDLLLQVLFYAEIAAEPGYFTIADVIAGLNRKLIRRHPHVFAPAAAGGGSGDKADGADRAAIDSAQVLRNWDAIKQEEAAARSGSAASASAVPASVLDTIPRSLPALLEARKLGSRAAKDGFDWPNVDGLFEKMEEEAAELRQAMRLEFAGGEGAAFEAPGATAEQPARQPAAPEAIVSEVGDLLFTAVNLARHLRVDPEFALRHTNAKFRRRFSAMEAASPKELRDLSALDLESLWTKAKEAERLPCRTKP